MELEGSRSHQADRGDEEGGPGRRSAATGCRDERETAVAELAGLIGRHCVGKTVTAILDRDRRETGVDS